MSPVLVQTEFFDLPIKIPWLVLGLTGFVLWKTAAIFYRLWFHPLSHFPGPFLGRASSIYRSYWFLHGNEQENHLRLHRKYGPVVRYSPNGLIVNDPTLIPVIYHMKADKTNFNAANFGSVTTFTMMSHKDHVASKKRISHAYTMKNMLIFETEIDNRLDELIAILSRAAAKEKGIDSLFHLHWFNFDVVSQLCFGKPFGFLKEERDVHGLIQKFADTIWLGEFLAIQENLAWYVRCTKIGRYLFMVRPTDTRGIGAVMGQRDRVVDSMVGPNREIKEELVENSLLSRFLSARNADGSPMDMREIKNELLTAIQAGSETTSLNLAQIVFHIARNADIQKTLQKELDDAENSGTIPSRESIVSYHQVSHLPYLSACIRESLRYCPSNAQIPRASPEMGLELDGKYVPPGTYVSTSAWIVGRDEKLYGDDPHVFRPTRWLEASPDQLKQRDRFDMIFGYGARKCLGRHLASIQLWKVIAEIFRRFEVEVEDQNFQPCGIPLNWHVTFRAREA